MAMASGLGSGVPTATDAVIVQAAVRTLTLPTTPAGEVPPGRGEGAERKVCGDPVTGKIVATPFGLARSSRSLFSA